LSFHIGEFLTRINNRFFCYFRLKIDYFSAKLRMNKDGGRRGHRDGPALREERMRRFMALMAWLALSVPLSAAAEPVTLKLSFFASDTEVNYARAIKPWVDAVNSDPSGAVKIEAYPNGALGKALPAQPQLVLDGVADIAFVNPSLGPGRFPDDQVFELPGLLQNLKEGVRLYEELLKANLLRGYSDYYVIGAFMNPQYMVFARRPIKSLVDLKGMKVRINGAVIGQTVKELGMVPVLMPPNEVVEAIGRGTIDATTTVPAAIVDFGIDRVTSHDYLLPLGAGPLAVLMNRKKFEALPQQARDAIAKYSIRWIDDTYVRELGQYNDELIVKFKADPKRTVTAPSSADLASLQPVYAKVIAEWVAKSPGNAALLSKARELLARIRANQG
jgi:TRAP-type C4-dicarboxylate transport system substrate-binding protein